MKRKLIFVISAIILVGGITGCGSKIKTTGEQKEGVVTEEENTIAEIEDENVADDDNANLEEMFTTKEVEGGVAIMNYNATGENEIVEIPNEIRGKSVVSIGTIDEICIGFPNDSAIKKIIIPDSVKVIGESTFSLCDNLETVEFGIGIEELGEKAFYGCVKLKELKFSEGLKKLGEVACGGCWSLTTVHLPESLTEIGDGNFLVEGELVITAPSGSVAEEYAKSCDITFEEE